MSLIFVLLPVVARLSAAFSHSRWTFVSAGQGSLSGVFFQMGHVAYR